MKTASSTMQEIVSSQYAKITPSRQGRLSTPSSALTGRKEKTGSSYPETTSIQPHVSALTGPSWPGSPGTIQTCLGTGQSSGLPTSNTTDLWENPIRLQQEWKNHDTDPSR